MRFMTRSEWKAFASANWKGASVALLAILIAAVMVSFSGNTVVTDISFLALLMIGVISVVLKIAKTHRKPKTPTALEWVPGPIRLR